MHSRSQHPHPPPPLTGIERFKKAAAGATDGKIPGPEAFVLWDTFGFPVDLTQLMAEERGMAVDMAGYEAAMAEAREKSRQVGGRVGGCVGGVGWGGLHS